MFRIKLSPCLLFVLFLAVFLGHLMTCATPAQADAYAVSIRHGQAVSSQLCDDAVPMCTLPLPDKDGMDGILAHIYFSPGGMTFQFEQEGRHFSTSGSGGDFYLPIGSSGSETRTVTLYRPYPLATSDSDKENLREQPVQRASRNVTADLDITVTVMPSAPAPDADLPL